MAQRNKVRIRKDLNHGKQINKLIKYSVKIDRSLWLNDLISNASWTEIRKLRKPPKNAQGRVLNIHGDHVFTNEGAETLAEYYEKMQWHIRPEAHVEIRDKIFDTLPVILDAISLNEIKDAISHLKMKKSPGSDGIVSEMWRAFLSNNDLAN